MRLRKLPLGQHATCKSSKASATTAATVAATSAAASPPWPAPFGSPPVASMSAGAAAAAANSRRFAQDAPTWPKAAEPFAPISFPEHNVQFQDNSIGSSSDLLSSENASAEPRTIPRTKTDVKGKNKAVEAPQPERLPNTISLQSPDKGADPQEALAYALRQLRQYNRSADDLSKACGRPQGLGSYHPYAIQKALLAFGRAKSQLHQSFEQARVTLYQPSTSQIPMRPISKLHDDYHAAVHLLNMLDKRVRSIISKICDARRDGYIEKSAPGPSNHSGFKDVKIYNVMLSLTLGHLDDLPLFRTVMIALERRQIQPNRATLTVILQHACKRRDVSLVSAGIQLGLNMLKAGEPPARRKASTPPRNNHLPPSDNQRRLQLDRSSAGLSTTQSRSHSHPLVRLMVNSVQARDSYLLVALIETLDTFGIPYRPRPAYKEAWKTPWHFLSASSVAALLYPSIYSRGRVNTAPANHRAGVSMEEIAKEDEIVTDGNVGSLLHKPGNSREGPPQHHPFVLTAVLTALSNEGRTIFVTRLWKLIKQLSHQSLIAASTPASPDDNTPDVDRRNSQRPKAEEDSRKLEHVTFAKKFLGSKEKTGRVAMRRGWLIPVRAATVYAKSLTLFLLSHARLGRRRSMRGIGSKRRGKSRVAGLTSQSSASSAAVAARTLHELAAGASSRRSGPKDRQGTYLRRCAYAQVELAKCYLFLRKHWGLEHALIQRQVKASTDGSRLSQSGTTGSASATNNPDHSPPPRNLDRPASDLPDKYFFAVMLNCWLPRQDGPLAFVDWRMITSRLRKRFPDGLRLSQQPEDQRERLVQLLHTFGPEDERGFGNGQSGAARSANERAEASGAQSSAENAAAETRLPVRKRRILRTLNNGGPENTLRLSGSDANLALVDLVLADLQTLGIEVS